VTQPALWLLSLQAFAAVAVLLTALALAVQTLTWLFRAPPLPAPSATPASATPAVAEPAHATPAHAMPAAPAPGAEPGAERGPSDPTVVAAVQAAAQRVRPGARVVRIEELR
jgi:hypothetical protein